MVKSNRIIIPKQTHYNSLRVDEFWTYGDYMFKKVLNGNYLVKFMSDNSEKEVLLLAVMWEMMAASKPYRKNQYMKD